MRSDFWGPQEEGRGFFDTAQICQNGHVITSMMRGHPEYSKAFCPSCGESTISQCPNCNATIKGHHHLPRVVDFSPYHPPAYCDACGQPYPWTSRIKESAAELIELDEALEATEKDDFKGAIKDLVVDTPKTKVAIVKYKTYIKKAGKEVAGGLKDILIEVVSETVKKAIWG